MLSAISGFAASCRMANASSAALRARSSASSRGLRAGKDATLPQRVVQHRALEVAPFFDVSITDHHEVDRDIKVSQGPAQADELGTPALEMRLDC
jgi:hypothetical protein